MTEQDTERAHIRLLEQMLSACHTASNERREALIEAREHLAELRAHIERWAAIPDYEFDPPAIHRRTEEGKHALCSHCKMSWPCPTVVLAEIPQARMEML